MKTSREIFAENLRTKLIEQRKNQADKRSKGGRRWVTYRHSVLNILDRHVHCSLYRHMDLS